MYVYIYISFCLSVYLYDTYYKLGGGGGRSRVQPQLLVKKLALFVLASIRSISPQNVSKHNLF